MNAFARLSHCLLRLCLIGAAVAIILTDAVTVRAQNVSVPYMIRSRADGGDKCLIFGNNGRDRYSSRFDWGAGNEFCGFPGGKQALLNNKQAVWRLVPLEGDKYMLKNASDGSDKCLIFDGNGTAQSPSRYDWGHGNEFCGFPGGKQALLNNKQAVWRVIALGGDSYMLKNASDGSDKCLIFGNNGKDLIPSRYDWGHGNEFCGFPGGKQALLDNKQAVFDLIPIGDAPITASQKDLAAKYAPVIWLVQGEEWLPSSIDFFAANVMAVCDGRTVTNNILALTTAMLPPGAGAPNGGPSSRCYFVTRQALRGPYDRPAFLHGQNPAQTSVPIYVFLYPDERYNDSGSFYAQYMTFYPYNFGKSACTGPAPSDHCLTGRVEMGDHVADWELMTIRFLHGTPAAVHVGAHGNDIPQTAWTYLAPTWTRTGQACTVNPIFCPFLEGPPLQWEGTHPVVYSAAGSHGVYGWAGKHNYKTTPVGDELNDYTGQGIKWQTWNNIVWSDDPKYSVLLNAYEGRWGNPHMGKSGCEVAVVPGWSCDTLGIPSDEYQLNDGPSLPNRQRDKPYLN